MGAPQIILICIYALSLMLNAYTHGKDKKGKHNVFITIVAASITFSLLIWGGFFG